MATAKLTWFPPRKCWTKSIGRTGTDDKGRPSYKRFYLGGDEKAALIAATRIAQVWEQCNKSSDVWTDDYLRMADAIIKGKTIDATDFVMMLPLGAQRAELAKLRKALPNVKIAVDQNDLDIPAGVALSSVIPEGITVKGITEQVVTDGPTLHNAFDDYIKYLEHSDKRVAWKTFSIACINRLKQFKDMPLADVGYSAIDELGQWLRSMPRVKDQKRPWSVDTVVHHIRAAKSFFNWLDAQDTGPYADWRLPRRWTDLLQSKRQELLKTYREKTGAKGNGNGRVQTFSLEELRQLYTAGNDRQKAFLLLGLNCGFTQADIAALTWGEVNLTDDTPFIERDRTKTGVSGRWLLWAETVAALKIQKKGKQTDNIFTAKDHNLLVRISETGNRVDKIGASWTCLLSRCKMVMRGHGFKYLRKTGAQMILDLADAETASVYLAHGHITNDALLEVYASRDYSRLDTALLAVRSKIQPMFDCA